MEYSDKEILEARKAQEPKEAPSIYDETVILGKERLHFVKTDLYDGAFSIYLPESYIEMPESMAKIKYPMEQRPEVLRCNGDGSISFGLTWRPEQMLPKDVAVATNGFSGFIRRMYPYATIEDLIVGETEGVTTGMFRFKTSGMDGHLYQHLGFSSVAGRFLNFSFNMRFSEAAPWIPIVRQVLKSIRVPDVEADHGLGGEK